MKKYETPELKVRKLEMKDIITVSAEETQGLIHNEGTLTINEGSTAEMWQ